MASPFEFSYVFTVIGKIWEAMPVTLLLTFAPLFIGFLFGVPFAVIRRFNVPFKRNTGGTAGAYDQLPDLKAY